MSANVFVQLALRFAGLSLIAVGGANALIPAIHAQAVDGTHWLDERKFAQAVALAQIAPGPNLLFVPLVGWHAAGVPGALVALAAFLVPTSVLAVSAQRLLTRYAASGAVTVLRATLRPIAAGLILASGIEIDRAAMSGAAMPNAVTLAEAFVVTFGVLALALRTKINPVAWLAAAAALGAVIPLRP